MYSDGVWSGSIRISEVLLYSFLPRFLTDIFNIMSSIIITPLDLDLVASASHSLLSERGVQLNPKNPLWIRHWGHSGVHPRVFSFLIFAQIFNTMSSIIITSLLLFTIYVLIYSSLAPQCSTFIMSNVSYCSY